MAKTNYQGEIIINCSPTDTTMYFMKVNNREKLQLLYNALKDEIDANHDFIEGGQCANFLKKAKKDYNNLTDSEEFLTKLMIISDLYTNGEGMGFVKYQWTKDIGRNNGRMAVYGIKKKEKNNGKITYKPVKCS